MKLMIHVLKSKTSPYEIRIADPPFDVTYAVSLSINGQAIVVSLFEEAVRALSELELDEGEWFDCVQWVESLDNLVGDWVDGFRRHGELVVSEEYRTELDTMAATFERLAAMIRTVQFVDHDRESAQVCNDGQGGV